MILSRLGWAGGLFEGEGSVFKIGKQCAGASLTMVDEDVVQDFGNVIGFGKIRSRKHKPNHKQPWEWRCNSFEEVQALVAMLWTFFGKRRRAQAKRVLLVARAGQLHSRYRVARLPSCHPNKKHCAKGLCRPCYMRVWNESPAEQSGTGGVDAEFSDPVTRVLVSE